MPTPSATPLIHTFDFPPAVFDMGIDLLCAGSIALTENDAGLELPLCNGYMLLVVMTGSLTVLSDQTIIEAESTRCVLMRISESIPCVFRALREATGIFIVFGGTIADSIFEQLSQRAGMAFGLHPESSLLHNLNTIISDANSDIILSAHQAASRVYMILCDLCRCLEHDIASQNNMLVEQTVAIIRERYEYLYGVEDIADCVGVSKHHLIREFTHNVGVSPGRFLTQTRVENAKNLLIYSDYSVEVIGQLVGYANGNYFCKVFKRQTGITPREFRQQNASGRYFMTPRTILDTET